MLSMNLGMESTEDGGEICNDDFSWDDLDDDNSHAFVS